MATQNTLTITLTNASSVTLTLPTADGPDARIAAQNIAKNGVWDDVGNFYPGTAILKIAVS